MPKKLSNEKEMLFMKNEIQLILEELKNIEKSENTEMITRDKIAEICEKHGATFEELRDSVLKILADETGVSLDELRSLSFTEISEDDLVSVSGGASQMQRVKAASLAAILGCGTFANSQAAQPSKHNRQTEVTASEQLDHRTPNKPESKKHAAAMWALGIGAPTLAVILGLGFKKYRNSLGSKNASPQTTSEQLPKFTRINRKTAQAYYKQIKNNSNSCTFWMTKDCKTAYENQSEKAVRIVAAAQDNPSKTQILFHTNIINNNSTFEDIQKLEPTQVTISFNNPTDNTKWLLQKLNTCYAPKPRNQPRRS